MKAIVSILALTVALSATVAFATPVVRATPPQPKPQTAIQQLHSQQLAQRAALARQNTLMMQQQARPVAAPVVAPAPVK
jgi:hypothetical protein